MDATLRRVESRSRGRAISQTLLKGALILLISFQAF
jgi:hypothetical protein